MDKIQNAIIKLNSRNEIASATLMKNYNRVCGGGFSKFGILQVVLADNAALTVAPGSKACLEIQGIQNAIIQKFGTI